MKISDIEVHIINKEKLKAYVNVKLGSGEPVRGIKIIKEDSGFEVIMPKAHKNSSLAKPKNKSEFNKKVIKRYMLEKLNSIDNTKAKKQITDFRIPQSAFQPIGGISEKYTSEGIYKSWQKGRKPIDTLDNRFPGSFGLKNNKYTYIK